MIKKRLIFFAKVVASVVAIAVIAVTIDLEAFIDALSRASARLLLAAFALALALQALNAFKIKLLLPGLPIGFGYILVVNFTATFLRLTIPTDLGAELGRGYYFSKKTGSTSAAFSAIVLDRYFGLFSQFLVLALASFVFGVNHSNRFWIMLGGGAGIAAVCMPGLLLLFTRLPPVRRSSRKGLVRVTHAFSRLSDHVRKFRAMPLRMAAVAGISIGYHCITLGMIMTASAAYKVSLQWHEAAAVTLSSAIGMVMPVTVAGLGITEGIYAALFALFSLQKEVGVAVSLTMRAFAMIVAIPGVLFFIYGERVSTLRGKREP